MSYLKHREEHNSGFYIYIPIWKALLIETNKDVPCGAVGQPEGTYFL